LKANKVYHLEKRFKEVRGLIGRDDLFVRQLPSGRFIVTMPHPSEDTEFILSTWENPKVPREFVDMGRCVNAALKVGAQSIHFRLLKAPADKS